MIKCNVTVNGVISKAASMRTNKEGKSFVAFAVTVGIVSNGETKKIEVSVLKEGTDNDLANYTVGKRVEIAGGLTIKKYEERFYLNLFAENLVADPPSNEDCINGELEFKGTVGKQVEEKTTRKGKTYLTFSGFSTEKKGENFEYTWVRFVRFSPKHEPFLSPKGKIWVKGSLELSMYQEKVNLNCIVKEISEWNKQDYQGNNK